MISTLSEKLGDEIDEVAKKCDNLKSNGQSSNSLLNNNIIIRNLPEREHENTTREVNKILKDGLKLRDVAVDSATKKQNRQDDRKSGIIIATCKTKADKQVIMKTKRHLKEY